MAWEKEQSRLDALLKKHRKELCPDCEKKIDLGDVAWNEASTEAGTPCSTIYIHCQKCQTEIARIESWTSSIENVEEVLNVLEEDWKQIKSPALPRGQV